MISKRPWWKGPLLVVGAALGLVALLVSAHPAYADTNAVMGFVNDIIITVLSIISGFLGKLTLTVIDLVITVSGYNNFIDADVVNTGWVLVRDVANMFYIFVLLVIAFGTMLKIEAYSWKKLLPRLIITAVVVNLSRTIMGVIIDFAQVIMITFVNGYAAAAGGNFAQGFNLDTMFKIKQTVQLSGNNTDFQVVLAYLLGTVMLGIALVVLAVFLAILIGRIITIWILVILAPMAFLLGTFPKGQEYYGKWWKQFQNAVIVGPVLAFFLWLSLATMSGGNSWDTITAGNPLNGAGGDVASSGPDALSVGNGQAGGVEKIGSFVVSIAMLMIGLQMTQELGVMGSSLAGGAASSIKSFATKAARAVAVPAAAVVATGGIGALGLGTIGAAAALGGTSVLPGGGGLCGLAGKGVKKAAGYFGEAVKSKVARKIYESPLGAIPAYFKFGAQHREEELKRAESEALASRKTRYHMGHDKYSPDYLRLERQKREASAAKDFQEQFESNAFAATTGGKAMLEKFTKGDTLSHEQKDLHRGVIRLLFNAAYVDDIMDMNTPEMKKVRDTLLHDVVVKNDDGTVNEEETNKARMTKSTENYRKLMIRGTAGDTKDVDDILWLSDDELKAKSPEEKQKIQGRLDAWSDKHQDELALLTDMKNVGKKTGHYENMGMADSRDGKYRVNTLSEQAGVINGELVKFGLVEKAKMNPHSIMQLLGYDGNKPGGMTDLGKLIFNQWMQGMDETNLSRNFLGRTANDMMGLGPQESPPKNVDEDVGGWLQLHGDYVNSEAGAQALKLFFSNPLLLKGLYSKATGIAPGKIGQKLDKFKFVVGNKEVSLKEITENDGDIRAVLARKKEMSADMQAQVDYENRKKTAETKNEKFSERPPEKQKPPINSQQAVNEVVDVVEDLTGRGHDELEEVAAGLSSAVDEFRDAVRSLGGDELRKSLTGLVTALKGSKPKEEVKTILEGKAIATGADGALTPEARFASLLLTLVRHDNKRIIDALTRISRAEELKGKAKPDA